MYQASLPSQLIHRNKLKWKNKTIHLICLNRSASEDLLIYTVSVKAWKQPPSLEMHSPGGWKRHCWKSTNDHFSAGDRVRKCPAFPTCRAT
jgi:hypothetical protein